MVSCNTMIPVVPVSEYDCCSEQSSEDHIEVDGCSSSTCISFSRLLELRSDRCSGISTIIGQTRNEEEDGVETMMRGVDGLLLPEEFSTVDLTEDASTACLSDECQLRRFSVGDFDRIPAFMAVDEQRCATDATYRDAVAFLETVHGHKNKQTEKRVFCVAKNNSSSTPTQKLFEASKQYRDALNLLAGRQVEVTRPFVDRETFFSNLRAAALAPQPFSSSSPDLVCFALDLSCSSTDTFLVDF